MNRRYNNKLLLLLLIIAIGIPHSFSAKPVTVMAARTGTVTANSLNVRKEPSTTADKVQLNGTNVYLVKDETVNILETVEDFYYVSLKFNGKTVEGYVHKDYIDAEPLPTATPTPKPTVTQKPTQTPSVTAKPDAIKQTVAAKKVELSASVMASSLNIRSGPGTSYSKVGGLRKGDTVTVINEKTVDKEKWYIISFQSEGKTKTGYVLDTYMKLSLKKSIKGEIGATSLKIRTAANSKAAYLKNKNGNIISLKKGKSVTIQEEIVVSGVKWFKITFTVSDKKYTGYALSSQIDFKATVKAPTPTPTVKPSTTPKPTSKPKASAAPTPTVKPSTADQMTPAPSVTSAPPVTPTVTATPSISPTSTPSPTPSVGPSFVQIDNNTTLTYVGQPVNGFVCNTNELYIVHNLGSFANIMDSNNLPITLKNGQQLLVTDVSLVDGTAWYKVSLDSGIYGYVKGSYIYIGDTLPYAGAVAPGGTAPSVGPSPTPTLSPTPTPPVTNNMDFEAKLAAEGFPESYKAALRALHAQYPNWEFKAYHTGLDWNTVIAAESVPGRNVIPNSKGVEWKSLEEGAYNWKTDTFIVFDGSTWVTASKAAIAYYMDPRNFLTTSGIFQFEHLKYQSAYQNITGVENILKGTAMYNTYYTYTDDNGATQTISYAETFIKAAEYSGVSPYHLASRVKQEVVTGPTTLSNSVSGTYSGYEGLYNFYNIGANDSAGGGAIANGLNFAKKGSSNPTTNLLYMIPWTNPYRSIVGGSYFIGGSYINRGQDTIYLQKFNVTPISTFYHQYMTNVEAPYAEAKKVQTAYNGMLDSPIVFMIPVYLNMPQTAAPMPTTMFNPNNRMKNLKITDMNGNELMVTPTFSQTEYNYNLIVGNTVDTIQVNATTVSKKATIKGTGTFTLNVGSNTVVISVVAEDGSIANYTINIVRE
jgi:beta-N-acetylglucosaminidase/outer membrane biosynthesis protein TonB